MNTANGKERWHLELDGTIGAGPVVSGGKIFVGTDTGNMYALGERTEEAPIVLPAQGEGDATTSPAEFLWQAANGAERFARLGGIAVAPDGNLWAVDSEAGRILIFSPDGAVRDAWGAAGPSEGEFDFVLENYGGGYGDVGFDQDGNIYVLDSGNFRVQKFDRNRTFLTAWGGEGARDGEFVAPVTMAVDAQGNVYVADDGRGVMQKFDSDGNYLVTIGSRGEGDGPFQCIPLIGVDEEGNLYAPDCGRNLVQKFAPDGTFLAAWGSEGHDDGQFTFPVDAAVDAEGNVFVSDGGNNRVQVFAADGTFLTSWGSFGQGDGQFNASGAVALDGVGNIYVVDDGNGRIEKFRLLPPLDIGVNSRS